MFWAYTIVMDTPSSAAVEMSPNSDIKPKLLVVEDNPTNLSIFRGILGKLECDVIEATNGQDALRAIEQYEFALILMDIQLPDMDGFEIAEILSQDSRKRETPLIFVSSTFTDDMSRLHGYKLGAVDYITKPVDPFVFKSKVQVFLDLHQARISQSRLLRLVHKRNSQLENEIKERQKAEEEARHQATHDPLTDLPNRMLFMDRLEMGIARAKREQGHMGLIYIDIDRFKPVNDTYGHHAGDELLKQISNRLSENLRESDTVARLGGDEFAVVLEPIQNEDDAQRVISKLSTALDKPFTLSLTPDEGEITVQVGGSMGLAMYPDNADSEEALLRFADEKMYQQKESHQVR